MSHPLPLLLLLQAAFGPPLGVEYRTPPYWVPVDAPPLVAFTPPNLGAGQVLLLTVWPAERIAGQSVFASWFETKLTNPGETVLQRSATERRPANGLEVLTATLRVTIPQVGQVVRVVYGISAGERVAVAMLTANQDQLVNRHAAEARDFFERLRFPERAPPVATRSVPPTTSLSVIPPAGFAGTEPRGLFYRLWTGSGSMETRTRIFLPSDRMLRVEPFGGGDMIDLGRCNPDTCGSYRLEGAWLTVRWDSGNTERFSFARSGEGFTLDGYTFQPARALSAAEAVGNWVNPGGVNSVLEMKSDGSFVWGAGSAATTLRGRYELKGLTLTLNFTDGTSKQYALFAAGRTRPAGLISIAGSVSSPR